jgi:putative ABC transport system permease protein
MLRLILRSATYHWRTNLAVMLGVAAAVSVFAGALLVGDSVRGSLRDLAIGRLGATEHVVSSAGFFREALAGELEAALDGGRIAPLVVATGFVTHEASGRRAGGVLVYGVDERFWRFHGLEPTGGVTMSPGLAAEFGAGESDVLLVRLQRPSEIPIESLFGRKDDIGRTIRLTLDAVQPIDRLGEFSLQPQQADVRALFVPISRVQRDLGVAGQVNTLLVSGQEARRSGDPERGGSRDLDARLRSVLTLEDLGAAVTVVGDPPALSVEGPSGIIGAALESAALRAGQAQGLQPVPVFTYLANTLRLGDRQVPYSLITATDLSALPEGAVRLKADATDTVRTDTVRLKADATDTVRTDTVRLKADATDTVRLKADATDTVRLKADATGQTDSVASGFSRTDPIILNDWTARELGAAPGDRIEVDYYLWDSAAGLTTHTAAFTLDRIVPIEGLAADRQLAPEYPGITGSDSLADWDPPFPIDLARVRPVDERYWDDHRTTPKAFIEYARGRELWETRYGGATSLRFVLPESADAEALAERLRTDVLAAVPPVAMGVTTTPAREMALEASRGATDFGEYFAYFSFFLMVSALLLAVLFFRLGVEQRLRQIGVLRAAGFTIASIRRMLLAEALALAALGSALGVLGAVAYGRLIIYGLTTWWVGAVNTTRLTLHVSPLSLGLGALAGVLAAALCVVFSLRAVARMTPRALLTAQTLDTAASVDDRRARRARLIGAGLAGAGVLMLAAGFFMRDAQGGLFFGAGASLLVASMFLLSAWLRARDVRPIRGRGTLPVAKLGFRSAAFRPSRSVLSAALIAAAAFIIVSVDAFRRGGGELVGDPQSGTGGYVFMAESQIPLLHNPNDSAGREELVIYAPEFERVRFTRFRVRPGEDASCLNLYRPTNPTIVAPEPAFIEAGRFSFGRTLAETDDERANPWRLLNRSADDGTVPVIADQTSLQYVLHASVGDTFAIDTGGEEPLTLRFVAALSDSVLQGQLVMGEEHFTRLFPAQQGYRFFLIDAPEVRTMEEAGAIAAVLEKELAPFGFDAITAAERLEAFHQVENTYLSTFQALGGLGLLLGTLGLATVMFRNVLERRRELALLRAVGYDARRVSIMVMAEAVLLLAAGLLAGAVCAALAIAPAWLGRGGTMPGTGLMLLLAAVAIAGIVSSFIAARAAVRGNVLEALRAE